MLGRLQLALLFLGLALLALACNGGGGPPDRFTPGTDVTPADGATETPGQGLSPTPGTQKTPMVEDTPTPIATPMGGTPTAVPTPAAQGTPAVAPADLTPYQGQSIAEEECLFDPRTAIVNCPGGRIYAINPPLVGQDISCSILIVQGHPVAIRCSSQEPLQTVYYAIG